MISLTAALPEPVRALSEAVAGLTEVPWVYPLASASHILALALLVGPVILVDLRGVGVLRGAWLGGAWRGLLDTARVGLAAALASGLFLFLVQPADYLANPVFLAKLALVALGSLNALTWQARTDPPPAWRCAVSLSAWLAALILGRWIAFV